MNRILTVGLAAGVSALLSYPVYAKDGHGGGGGGGRGGGGGGRGGGGHVSAPAHVSVSHAPAMRAPSVAHFSAPRASAPHFSAPAQHFSAPHYSAPIAHTRPGNTFTPSVTRGRTFVQPRQQTPSMAFGGHVMDNNARANAAVRAQNGRNFSTAPTTQFSARGNARDFRVPSETSRSWDRGRTHEWHNHHFRFFNGDWVIIDSAPYDYGYPYDYDYGAPAPYVAPTYSYDYPSTTSQDMAMGAQEQLTRLGYSPGPVDGVIGPQTRDAIADFQNDHNLRPTGDLDTATVQALGL